MTTQNKNVPALRFPEFNSEWDSQELNQFFEERDSESEENLPLYSLTIEAGIVPKSKRYERSFLVKSEEDAYKVMLKNDFAFNPMNLRFGALARHKGDEKILVSKYYNVFFCNENADPSFAENYLTTHKMLQFYKKMATGSLEEKKRVHYLDFINFKLPFPSLPEQQKIAAFLTAVDEKIRQLTKKKDLFEQYKKGVMRKIFNQEIRFKDDNGNDFADWEEKKGNEIFESVSNKNHNSDLPILAITQEFGAIPRDLIDYQISVTDKSVESYKVVEVGDFVISLRSFQGGIEYSNYKGICSPAYIILRSKVSINNLFYKHYLKTDFYIQQLNAKLEGIRDGKMISYKYFSEIELPFPSLEEQNKIAAFFTVIDDKINLLNQQLKKTQTFKKGLLQQMFI